MKRIIDISDDYYELIKNEVAIYKNDYKPFVIIANSTPLTECEAEDCRSLKDIKEMIERKADALDGQMLDAGGACIGLYFAIANDLPSVYPKSDKPSEADLIKANTQLKKQIEMLKLDRECDKPSAKWIIDGHHIRCSICNDYHAINDADNNKIASLYCPNCGAKMVEEQGENT